MQVLYDNVNLNSTPYSITNLAYENDPRRNVYAYKLSRERGEVIVGAGYISKTITIQGRIQGNDKSDLDDKIDTFMELVGRREKNLDIDHGTGTRRFIVIKTGGGIKRVFYQLNYADFEITFLAPEGVGKATTQTTETETAITDAIKTGSWTVGGSAYPTPQVQLTFTSTDTVSAVSLKVNGDKITINEAIADNDVVIFDIENKKVTLNGVEKDYDGIFPRFDIGANSYEIDITSTSHQYDLTLSYFKRYL